MKSSSTIEPLEARIAPAMVTLHIVNPTTATYTDVDGDHVTVKVSSGTLTAALFTGIAAPGGLGDQLQDLNLSGGGFDHANVTVTVKKIAGGNGLANIGYINSTGHDLGTVTVAGDLGQIDAGDGNTTGSLGIKTLKVSSLGQLGTDTQGGGDLESHIIGGLGSLKVTHDFALAYLNVTGATVGVDDATGMIGPVKIGGSLVGGAADHSGEIHSTGKMGTVSIGEDLHGGSGALSGVVNSGGDLGNVTIGGSIVGGYLTGANARSGELRCFGKMGVVKVAHDVVSGAGSQSAYITAEDSSDPATTTGSIVSVTIGGSLIGNSASGGAVESASDMGPVKIGGSIVGGLVNSAGKLGNVTLGGSLIGGSSFSSGVISSAGEMGVVRIGGDMQASTISFTGVVFGGATIKGAHVGGSIIGGAGNLTVNTFQEGGIISNGDLGPATIGHDLVGGKNGTTHDNTDAGVIESGGRIASVTIGGSIIAGTNLNTGTLENSGAILAHFDIGSVTVKGSILGSTGVGHGVNPVIIAAAGQKNPGPTTNVAIGKIAVRHRVDHAQILAGYDTTLAGTNADAQVGPVSVGGAWVASSLVAGARNLGADHMPGGGDDNINFGNPDDAKITGGTDTSGIVSRIASITIKGLAIGTPSSINGLDHFGFVAEQIGKVKIGNASIAPTANPFDIGETGDFTIHLLA